MDSQSVHFVVSRHVRIGGLISFEVAECAAER